MKCVTNGHEMLKGQKFCGECGSNPASDDAQCGACEASMLKAARFCGECGTAAIAPGEDLDAAVAELEEFQKARMALAADLQELPAVDDQDLGTVAPTDMLKAVTGTDGAPTGDYDVLPIIDAMLKGQALAGRQGRSYAEHTLRFLGHLSDGVGRIAKANIALAGRLKDLDSKIAVAGAQPRGRVALPGTMLAEKMIGGGQVAPGGAAGRQDLRGIDLMAKCLVIGPQEGGLNSEEVSLLEHYTNSNGGIPELVADKRTGLASRVTQVLSRAQQAAH